MIDFFPHRRQVDNSHTCDLVRRRIIEKREEKMFHFQIAPIYLVHHVVYCSLFASFKSRCINVEKQVTSSGLHHLSTWFIHRHSLKSEENPWQLSMGSSHLKNYNGELYISTPHPTNGINQNQNRLGLRCLMSFVFFSSWEWNGPTPPKREITLHQRIIVFSHY